MNPVFKLMFFSIVLNFAVGIMITTITDMVPVPNMFYTQQQKVLPLRYLESSLIKDGLKM